MTTIFVYNRSKRNFNKVKGADGAFHILERNGFLEMEEVAGLRLIADYPRELTSSKQSGPNTEDLRRREQSLKDREKALAEKEAALEAREKALAEKESEDSESTPKKRGRPAKVQTPESEE